jgi:hypothetical protein
MMNRLVSTLLFLFFSCAVNAQNRSDFASIYLGNSISRFEVDHRFGKDEITLRNQISPLVGYEYSLRLFNLLYLNGGMEVSFSRVSVRFNINDSLMQDSEKFTNTQYNLKTPFVFSYRLKATPTLTVVPAAGLMLLIGTESSSEYGVFSSHDSTTREHFNAELNDRAIAQFNPLLRLGLEYRLSEKIGIALTYRYIFSPQFEPDASGWYRYIFNGATTSFGMFTIDRDRHGLTMSLVLKR